VVEDILRCDILLEQTFLLVFYILFAWVISVLVIVLFVMFAFTNSPISLVVDVASLYAWSP
jgi:hypothetical protein